MSRPMKNHIFTLCLLSLCVLLTSQSAQAISLPEGCYSGKLSDGSEVLLSITRTNKNAYSVKEYTTGIDFGFPDADGRIDYRVKPHKQEDFFRGIQAKSEQVSTSFSVNSTVSLRKIKNTSIRYHLFLKIGPHEIFEGDPKPVAKKAKGTIKKQSAASCDTLLSR
jgi:hypothetical protein